MSRVVIGGLLALMLVMTAPAAFAETSQEASETARLLALLLDTGRVVVAANQVLINDKERGDKGFTPAAFERELIARFKDRTGVDLWNLGTAHVPERAKPLLADLLEAAHQTVSANQPIINKKGIAFKNFTPAHFGTQTATRFRAKTGVYLKQITLDQYLRNAANRADDFEADILQQFARRKPGDHRDRILSQVVDGGKSLRVMLPLYYGSTCLSCYGEPKGDLDLSGYRKEGASEGALGGAISVKLPLR